MKVTLYGIKNCDSIKKAKKWLENQNITYNFHDYRVDGIDKSLIEQFLASQDWQVLLNKRGTTWRQQSEAAKNSIDQKTAIDLMIAHPAMIKRPILETDNQLLVGFKADQYQDIFAAK